MLPPTDEKLVAYLWLSMSSVPNGCESMKRETLLEAILASMVECVEMRPWTSS